MMEIIDCEQNDDKWLLARMSMPTASKFQTVLAKGEGGGKSVTREDYMLDLIGESITGVPMPSFSNAHTDRGHELEAEARAAYEFENDVKCDLVGFIVNGNKGASPDALIGSPGILEIKTRLPKLQLKLVLGGEVPASHKAQIQGQLWVAEREWSDLYSYWPGLPSFQKRVYRDDAYINTVLWPAIDKFITEMKELEEKIRNV